LLMVINVMIMIHCRFFLTVSCEKIFDVARVNLFDA